MSENTKDTTPAIDLEAITKEILASSEYDKLVKKFTTLDTRLKNLRPLYQAVGVAAIATLGDNRKHAAVVKDVRETLVYSSGRVMESSLFTNCLWLAENSTLVAHITCANPKRIRDAFTAEILESAADGTEPTEAQSNALSKFAQAQVFTHVHKALPEKSALTGITKAQVEKLSAIVNASNDSTPALKDADGAGTVPDSKDADVKPGFEQILGRLEYLDANIAEAFKNASDKQLDKLFNLADSIAASVMGEQADRAELADAKTAKTATK